MLFAENARERLVVKAKEPQPEKTQPDLGVSLQFVSRCARQILVKKDIELLAIPPPRPYSSRLSQGRLPNHSWVKFVLMDLWVPRVDCHLR